MSEIQEVNAHIEALKEVVELGRQAEKLASNREFRKLILETFMVKEAARYAHVSGDVDGQSQSARDEALAICQAAGHLKRWLSRTVQQGQIAERELESNRALRDALAAEAGE